MQLAAGGKGLGRRPNARARCPSSFVRGRRQPGSTFVTAQPFRTALFFINYFLPRQCGLNSAGGKREPPMIRKKPTEILARQAWEATDLGLTADTVSVGRPAAALPQRTEQRREESRVRAGEDAAR